MDWAFISLAIWSLAPSAFRLRASSRCPANESLVNQRLRLPSHKKGIRFALVNPAILVQQKNRSLSFVDDLFQGFFPVCAKPPSNQFVFLSSRPTTK